MNSILLTTLFCCTFLATCVADDEPNYDETKIPAYRLPDPLVMQDGTPITSSAQWQATARPELFRTFESQVYGRAPQRPTDLHWKTFEADQNALGDTAIRKQVTIYFGKDETGPQMDLLMYLPKAAATAIPVFLGLNFNGNHSVTDDVNVRLSTSWIRAQDGVIDNRATEAARGIGQSRWPIREILARGYGVATIYYGDIDPDFDDGFENGVHQLTNQNAKPAADEWGSIATWAWGLSRALDYLQADGTVDGQRVIVVGHSRLGKTSLWAGAADERFAMVVSNDSGCGGAALSRRRVGERVARINTSFPHWFADNFNQYNDREDELPIDQHQLIALMAPRPVLICSADEDLWADPRGEYLAGYHASPVYGLFGKQGLARETMPSLNELVGGSIGYQIRPGKHDMTLVDWTAYMDFADTHLKPRP